MTIETTTAPPTHPSVGPWEALHAGMAEWVGADAVTAPASTWIVTATVPDQRRDTSSR
jgi:hypothetical protein